METTKLEQRREKHKAVLERIEERREKIQQRRNEIAKRRGKALEDK